MEPFYITGFTDGEGCFSVSFNYRNKFKTGVEVRPSFSISQNKRNLNVLKEIQNYFGVGNIRFSKRDDTYKYEVRSLTELYKVIIPFFRKFPLRTSKRTDFELFFDICQKMQNNSHNQIKSLRLIIEKAYLMNLSGKRRIKKEDILKYMSKVKI